MNRPGRRSSKPTTPLTDTSLEVTITDLVAEYVLLHRFRNDGETTIEAVFSFPVPLDAAFLGMRATLAGETLIAEIQPQRQASRVYDDAIADGNSAVLLRAPEPGVLCTSLGNLLPGETGELELKFVTALRVADCAARFSLPFVHRPRYGTWGLEELEVPTYDFAVEHPMSATIRVTGLLASAPVTCATHAARFSRIGDCLELSISQAMLDRDLVVTFELSQDMPPNARLIDDGDADLGLVSFVLPARDGAPQALDLCLVLDGSGSMSGDAIEQSRKATLSVVDALGDRDRIQVLRFGSSVAPMFRRPLLATPRVRDALRGLVMTIASDLGGTEMGQALGRAIEELGPAEPSRSRAIVLVTDGAVQPADVRDARSAALAAGIRIFVVAVGSSAGAEVLGPLATFTGAVLERAVPAEPIDAGVMRQFRRARESGPVSLEIDWPSSNAAPISAAAAYPGDALSLAACLPHGAEGAVAIRAPTLNYELRLPLASRQSAPGLRALVGQRRYRSARAADRESIALRYGLLTPETSAILVKVRADGTKADGLPTIVRVPQMVSDGMVGASDVLFSRSVRACHSASYSPADLGGLDSSAVDVVSFLRHQKDAPPSEVRDGKIARDREEVMMAVPADRARAIYQELYRVLIDSWQGSQPSMITLGEAIERLPDDMCDQAVCLLKKCGLLIDDEAASARVLFALTSALALPALSDDDEAMFSAIIANSPNGDATAAQANTDADAKLARAISVSMRKETVVKLTDALRELIRRVRRS